MHASPSTLLEKKWPELDFNAAEETYFQNGFDIFYGAVFGFSARVPGQYIQFRKRFMACMESASRVSTVSYKIPTVVLFQL